MHRTVKLGSVTLAAFFAFLAPMSPNARADVLERDDIACKVLETLIAVPAPDKSADEGGNNDKDNRY